MSRHKPNKPHRIRLRRKPVPPPWRCPDCDSEVRQLGWDDDLGMWRHSIAHDDTCPALAGAAGLLPDAILDVDGRVPVVVLR